MQDNNQTNPAEQKIFCDVCGAEMNASQRCCIKCGALNYNHPANASMRKYAPSEREKERMRPYVIGGGTVDGSFGLTTMDNRRAKILYSEKIGKRKTCQTFNIIFLFLGILLVFLGSVLIVGDFKKMIMDSSFTIAIICLILVSLETFSLQLVFMKCNETWWKALIPFYRLYVLFDITMEKGAYVLLCLIPVVGIMIPFYKLGKLFNKPALLVALFPFIYVPVLAFDESACFDGIRYIDHKPTQDDQILNSDFKTNERIKNIIVILILVCMGALLYTSRTYLHGAYVKIITRSFKNDVGLIMSAVKYDYRHNNYTCKMVDNSSDSEVDGTEETSNEKIVDSDELSTFYIKFYNANKYFGTSSYIGNSKINDFPYRGYVRVTGKGLRRKYTLCVDDFHYGTSEITEDDLDTLEIKEGVLCQLPEDAIVCEK